ncbi:50S ribosomal protein L10, partial [Patescibacteria group bacterium]|nr:50S ribosomal protein L10 [Patescibacteria group bacterium]
MAKTKQQKEEMLADIKDSLNKSKSVVFTVNKGLNAEEMVKLRKITFQANTKYSVVKKTLLKIALKDAKIDLPDDGNLDGPLNVLYSYDDEIVGPKTIYEFGKESSNLEII